MSTILFLRPEKKYYLSFFRWILFLFIIVYHSLYLFTKGGFLPSLGSAVYNYIPFIVDCFFVMSGFLLIRNMHLKKTPTHLYIGKRFLDFFPLLFIFWLSYMYIGKMSLLDVDLIAGFNDVIGLSVFGFQNYHNQLNYTWFLYTLFWCNILFFLILKFNRFALFFIVFILITTGFTISNYWIEGNVITPKPYEYVPISFGLFRGLLSTSIGVLAGFLALRTPAFIQKSAYLFPMLSLLECIIFLLSILMFSQLTPKQFYLNELSLFGLLLFSLSFEKSLFFYLFNRKFLGYGDSCLLGSYIFSAIVICWMSHFLKANPHLTQYGDRIYLSVILISIFFGTLTYLITKILKKLIIRPN